MTSKSTFFLRSPPPWSAARGPPPCRDQQHPKGFPWADGRTKARAREGNLYVEFVIRVLDKVQREGLHSLTSAEKKILQRATDDRRG